MAGSAFLPQFLAQKPTTLVVWATTLWAAVDEPAQPKDSGPDLSLCVKVSENPIVLQFSNIHISNSGCIQIVYKVLYSELTNGTLHLRCMSYCPASKIMYLINFTQL